MLDLAGEAGFLRQRTVNADVADVELHRLDATDGQALQHQREDFEVRVGAGFAIQLGADLDRFA